MAIAQKVQDEPTPADVMARMAQVLEMLANRPDAASSQMLAVNEAISSSIQEMGKQFAAQNSRSVLPSNAQNLGPDGNGGRSFYRPKGDMHPDYAGIAWHRQPWHNGHRISLDEVNPDEIATWNELSQLLPNSTSRRTARDGRWKCWVGENNGDIYISVPTKTIEDQMNQPATHAFIIREFIDGKSVDPASLYAELVALKAQLEAQLKPAVTA